MLLLSSLQFLTCWVVLMVVFHQYTFENIDLLYLTFLAFIVGSYISFVNPKFYILKNKKDDIVLFEGWNRFIVVDLTIHALLFVFICYKYYWYYKPRSNSMFFHFPRHVSTFIAALSVVILYMASIDIVSVYNVSFHELFIASFLATFLYFLL